MGVVVAAVAVVLVGCAGPGVAGGPAGTPGSRPTPVPWIAATPAPQALPTPAVPSPPTDLASCAAADLHLAISSGTGAGGWWVRSVVIANGGSEPCLIRGPLTFALRDGDRSIGATAAVEPSWSAPGWVVLAPGETADPRTPRDGQGRLTLASYGNCAAATFDAVAATFAGPVDVVSPVPRQSVGGRCDAPGQQLRLSVSLVGPAVPPAVPSVPFPPLAFRIDAPTTAIAGASLRFLVWIRTTGATAYDWSGGCPDYLEWLGGHPVPSTDAPGRVAKPEPPAYAGAAKERHPLNCAAAGPLLPGDERAFEIRIAVPPDARGTDTLRWDLPYAGAPDAASATIEVLPPRR